MAKPARSFRLELIAWFVLAALASLSAISSAAAQPATCAQGLKSRSVAELIFGRNIGDIVGAVSEEEWLRFLDEVVTPRFPGGLTVLDAYGQWRDGSNGAIEREPAKVLLIVLDRETAQRPRLAEIAEAYKRRFSQQSVIVMVRRACVLP